MASLPEPDSWLSKLTCNLIALEFLFLIGCDHALFTWGYSCILGSEFIYSAPKSHENAG